MKSYSRLTLYTEIKNKLRLEPYLKSYSCNARKSITKIRISAHNLPIEKGRYRNLARQKRLCTFCKVEISDEYHCLFEYFHPN